MQVIVDISIDYSYSMLRVLPRVASLAGRSTLRHHSAAPAALSDELRKKINGMVTEAPVVVFMKGTQKEPACGFSNNVKRVLDFHDVAFRDHNVLVDAELREGIKAYSEWPTIPQVYVKGEFVGGCDIMIQMHKDGELSDLFDKHEIPNKFGDCKKKE